MDTQAFYRENTDLIKTTHVVETTSSVENDTRSHFGGYPLMSDETWPQCDCCGEKMPLFVQIDITEIPNAERFGIGEEGRRGLLKVFYCTDPSCEYESGGFPFQKNRRVVLNVASSRKRKRSDEAGALATVPIIGYREERDFPNWEEKTLSNRVEKPLEIFRDYSPVSRDKIGGWPAFLQGARYPKCSECQKDMQMILQINSEEHVGWAFGDMGRAYVMQCPTHRRNLTLQWDCR